MPMPGPSRTMTCLLHNRNSCGVYTRFFFIIIIISSNKMGGRNKKLGCTTVILRFASMKNLHFTVNIMIVICHTCLSSKKPCRLRINIDICARRCHKKNVFLAANFWVCGLHCGPPATTDANLKPTGMNIKYIKKKKQHRKVGHKTRGLHVSALMHLSQWKCVDFKRAEVYFAGRCKFLLPTSTKL